MSVFGNRPILQPILGGAVLLISAIIGTLVVTGNATFGGDVTVRTLTATSTALDAIKVTNGGGVSTTLLMASTTRLGPGAAGAPSFTFASDTDTGIYSSAADTVNITTGGTSRFIVNSLGNIGVGVSPSQKFQILGNLYVQSGNLFLNGYPTYSIQSAVNGNIAFGTDGSTGWTFAAETGDAIKPSTTNLIDFGTPSLAWKDVHASGTYYGPVGSVSAPTYKLGAGANGMYMITDNSVIGFTVNGTARAAISSGAIRGVTNNAMDLGAANVAFKNIYASGTVVIMDGLPALSVASDLLCWGTAAGSGGLYSHQALNCTVSSARFKENIASLSTNELLEKAKKLRAVSFNYKEGHYSKDGIAGTGKASAGFVAEEVAMIDPMLVAYTSEYTPDDLAFEEKNYPGAIIVKDGKKLIPQTVDYARVTYVLTGAIQAIDERLLKVESKVCEIASCQ